MSYLSRDWPGQPDDAEFVASYEAIGCPEPAAGLAGVVATFPFPEPRLDSEARFAFIEANWDEASLEVHGWGDASAGESDRLRSGNGSRT